MKRAKFRLLLLALCLSLGARSAQAQAAAPASNKVNDEVWTVIDDAGAKLQRLADKIPQEKYTWKPVDGVRTFSEVFLHVASGNYFFAQQLGLEPPAGLKLGEELEKSTTDKARIIEVLKASFEHLQKAVTAADAEKMVGTGNRQRTLRRVMIGVAAHDHEHLGQTIAYTRAAGFVPPWTEERQQRPQQPPKKSN